MASKGQRSKLDNETRARRHKAIEASKEPRRPKTHWDHVLEEMVWLSKDFEAERKWKVAQAKKVAIRASKGTVDQATRGEKRVKEEEQRLRKVALSITKDVKKFWVKIEKLVLYKHQLELDEKKKKALDKQLEFLLGQTERYSTMLAENLVSTPVSCLPAHPHNAEQQTAQQKEDGDRITSSAGLNVDQLNSMDIDSDFDVRSEDELEDDEHTIEEDEALITEAERQLELVALQNEADLPLEELLKRYEREKDSQEGSSESDEHQDESTQANEEESESRNGFSSPLKIDNSTIVPGRRCAESNGCTSISDTELLQVTVLHESSVQSDKKQMSYDFHDEQEDGDFALTTAEEKDDETTLSEEEELARAESNESIDEIALLQKESEIPIEELLARYKKVCNEDVDNDSVHSSSSEDCTDSQAHVDVELKQHPPVEETEVHGNIQPVVSSISEKPVEAGRDNQSINAAAAAVPMVENEKPCELQPVTDSVMDEEVESGAVLEDEKDNESRIADAAAAARSAQPTGNTFSTTKVRTKFPFLLKYPLREYQHIGLDWLVTMYDKRLNGILADEMGLGKTIMTIALLAHLACEKGIWGPHLIVVPTSVMLNWETEFLKWCPAFKILTYFGSAKERKIKRQGWMKPNYFHVCITTYRLVIQDSKIFKRKKWKYLILDEAHLIKNWKSQRWQTLLNFNSKRRILLTGTPLQNDLMELWSLMHFLMPHIFQSHQEFKDWFCNPISGMVEGQDKVNKEVVDRLHNVLRPFLLRRLKRDVEKQLPMKHEHVIYCRLSRRQRNLYEDFIASSETQATLASSNFFGMISVIMQLRKVCNHPDLFEGRPIVSSFDMQGIDIRLSSSVCSMLTAGPLSTVNLSGLGFLFTHLDFSMTSWESEELEIIATPSSLIEERVCLSDVEEVGSGVKHQLVFHGTSIFEEIRKALMEERLREAKERAAAIAWWNTLRCRKKPIYSTTFRSLVTVINPVRDTQNQKGSLSKFSSSKLAEIILSPVERFQKMINQVESFMFAIPAARAPQPVCWCCKSQTSVFLDPSYKQKCTENLSPLLTPLRPAIVRRQLYFPDRRLIQFDCGKLQELAVLLRRLKSEGHRALIFTQMTKMLDVLEAFINLYGYTYMRLDGSTPPEERQTLMQRFNTNPKIFLFILSTRSGGVGINLVGADTVIFYDSDWNPAMDQQAQDRCHRIGQTREVNIYRLISHSTIEENILKKANQKRVLDDLVIQSGGYNTDFFKKLDPMDLFSGHQTVPTKSTQKEKNVTNDVEASVSNADVEAALKHAEDEADYMALKKVEEEEAVDNQEFTEEAVVRLEDEELINEDEMKADEALVPNGPIKVLSKENSAILYDETEKNEERALTAVGKEDDVDMLADVKQMAAEAAAAGQTILSFEKQLRPIDRYAIRFLELWDPIIDKKTVESEIQFEEADWELDRIEKLKEDMEAEVDDDEEPLVYESWDADFATEAYRQRVEALAQHQLLEDLECEAKEKELADHENSDFIKNDVSTNSKPKSKKKPKKTKFKSLKKGALAESKDVQRELPNELICMDDEITSHELSTSPERVSVHSSGKKRKAPKDGDEERSSKKKPKKFRKINPERGSMLLDSDLPSMQLGEPKDAKVCDNVIDLEHKPASRSKMGGKISITAMPLKRVITIRTEKFKKKGNIWSRECYPSPDVWSSQEDAVLCALVNEYGSHWSLVSETLYGMTAGGFYRGRYRHPVHCCERFRELIQKHVLSAADNPNNEKAGNAGLGKSLVKVTEDNVRALLEITSGLPDNELILQKHFFAVLSTVWRTSICLNRHQNVSSSRNGFHAGGRHLSSMVSPFWLTGKMNFTSLSSKLVAAALFDAYSVTRHEKLASLNDEVETLAVGDQLEIVLELQGHRDDSVFPIPSPINLCIRGSDPPPSTSTPTAMNQHFRSSRSLAESRFRIASTACTEDFMGWASSAFLTADAKRRTTSKSQSLGKHKISSVFESAKSSRSKVRKTTQDSSDKHSIAADVQPMLTFPDDSLPEPSFDLTPFTSDFEIGALCDSFWFDMEGVCLETLEVNPTPDNYIPDVISGLDDSLSLPDFTDIG